MAPPRFISRFLSEAEDGEEAAGEGEGADGEEVAIAGGPAMAQEGDGAEEHGWGWGGDGWRRENAVLQKNRGGRRGDAKKPQKKETPVC